MCTADLEQLGSVHCCLPGEPSQYQQLRWWSQPREQHAPAELVPAIACSAGHHIASASPARLHAGSGCLGPEAGNPVCHSPSRQNQLHMAGRALGAGLFGASGYGLGSSAPSLQILHAACRAK